jgi:syntaxin-binding protein 5
MVAEMREQQEQEFQRQREAARTGRAPPKQNEEGYYAWMQRQIQERTENLGLAGDSMDRTAEASASWSDDVSKFVAKQKRQAALGLIGSKFSLSRITLCSADQNASYR